MFYKCVCFLVGFTNDLDWKQKKTWLQVSCPLKLMMDTWSLWKRLSFKDVCNWSLCDLVVCLVPTMLVRTPGTTSKRMLLLKKYRELIMYNIRTIIVRAIIIVVNIITYAVISILQVQKTTQFLQSDTHKFFTRERCTKWQCFPRHEKIFMVLV